MRTPSPVPAGFAAGPFSRRDAIETKQLTDHRLASSAFQQLMRGAYAAADLEVTHGLLIRGVRTLLPPDAVLGGRSALWAYGIELADPDEPVEVILPKDDRTRSRANVTMRGDLLRPTEIVETPWGPVTTPARTAFDLGRRGGMRTSVPLLDALAHRTKVTAEDVLAVARVHPGARNCRRLPGALSLMDDGAESVRESLLRIMVVEAGMPLPVAQYVIRDRYGRFVARVDLAWPDLLLALEYDGAHHDDPAQIVADRRRLNAIHSCGWTTLVIDRTQFRDESCVIAQIRALRAAASARRV